MRRFFIALFGLLSLHATPALADILSFNVGTSMTTAEQAGPTGARAGFWNNAVNSAGTLTWSSNFTNFGEASVTTASMTFPGPTAGLGSLGSAGSGDAKMLGSMVDLFGGSATSPNAVMTISNIQHSRYRVLVYNQPNDPNRVAGVQLNNGDTRFMRMLPAANIPANGAGYIQSFDTTSPGSNAAALSATQAHYVMFDNVTGSNVTLDLWGDAALDNTPRFRVAGVQIVPLTVDPGGPGSIGTKALEGTTTGATVLPLSGARIIRVDQNIAEFLQLREVIATEAGTLIDVATSAQGASITGSPQGHGGNLALTIDGVIQPDFGSHTAAQDINNFERIDLGQSRDLLSVEVLARSGCCHSRNANMQLSIYGDTAETNLLYTGQLLGMDSSPYSVLVDLSTTTGGTKTATLDPNLTTVMEIDTVSGQSDLLTVNQGTAAFTEMVFAGDLEVVLLGSGELGVGQEFNLFDADIFSGSFDNIILPDLAAFGLGSADWDLSQLSVDGTISITPEPATVGLWLTLGFVVCGMLARKRRLTVR